MSTSATGAPVTASRVRIWMGFETHPGASTSANRMQIAAKFGDVLRQDQ